MMRFLRQHGWVVGLSVLFVALFILTRTIQPSYGAGDFGSLVRAVLPYAFAVAAQTVVVIAGGIDLSVAAMMALTSVTAASMMAGASEEYALFVVPFVLAMGFVLGAVNGILIVVTRVPDIVVTLATLFVLQGAALLVLDAPGGGAALWLRSLIIGTVPIPAIPDAVDAWIPKALLLLIVLLCIVWIPLRRSQLGLSIYAIGSSQLAAFRSGVPVARTKILAYAHRRPVRGDGRHFADHEHRHRRADPRTLPDGQRGGGRARRRGARRWQGWPARPDHRRLHPASRAHRPDAARHRPQRHGDRRRFDHGGRRDVRRLHRNAEPLVMTVSATATQSVPFGRRFKRFMSDYPIVPLIVLLILLVMVLQILSPGIVNQRWIANTVKFAIPLALLAGCQTMVMLTGGIDLSVGTAATMAGFIVATQAVDHAPAVAIAIALVPAVLIGFVNGIGVGVFRVHPLIMTLGTSLIGVGCLQVYQRTVISTGTKYPDILVWLGTGVTWGFPNALLLFIPVAALLLFVQKRTGFGRLLYAIGDNERATRLAGVKYWQVILALYMFSSILAGIMGLLYIGLIKAASLSLAEPLVLPSVAAAVIGGTSIFGGSGSYTGTIVGALILTVLTTLLTILQMPEGARRMLFGAIVLLVTAAYLRIIEDR